MTLSQGRAIFIWGTVISTVIFLALTYDSLVRMPQRTHDENLDAQVVAGKWAWQRHNCNDCHTILGIGGYYAPDVTKVTSYRDKAWLSRFMADPEEVWPVDRKMPNLRLTKQEIADLIAFLTWVNGIDTNNWPPKPVAIAAETAPKPGERLFRANGCPACHRIGGIGGTVGPDLTQVGARREADWIEAQLKNPKSHDPNSLMPSFGQLPEQEIDDLVAYLSGLK